MFCCYFFRQLTHLKGSICNASPNFARHQAYFNEEPASNTNGWFDHAEIKLINAGK